uniref:Uncharacterized protein n=1 Tax=Grateloupia filicina TaxID=31455 RepID=A0A2S1FXI2_9FLOR|nr:hypothetical protein Grafi_p220 [Grateloupia filicina]AWD77476.1 hypothetical protein Grafi_p220 [Grateloupia filicina]
MINSYPKFFKWLDTLSNKYVSKNNVKWLEKESRGL